MYPKLYYRIRNSELVDPVVLRRIFAETAIRLGLPAEKVWETLKKDPDYIREEGQEDLTVQNFEKSENADAKSTSAETDFEINAKNLVEQNAETDFEINTENLAELNAETDFEINTENLAEQNAETDFEINTENLAEQNAGTDFEINAENLAELGAETDFEINAENLAELGAETDDFFRIPDADFAWKDEFSSKNSEPFEKSSTKISSELEKSGTDFPSDSNFYSHDFDGLKKQKKEFYQLASLFDPYLDELEKSLSQELLTRGFLNRWQLKQLKQGHSRFQLGFFQIVDSLGLGGYGHVFLGRLKNEHKYSFHLYLKERNTGVPFTMIDHLENVALKVLPKKAATHETIRKFLQEVEAQQGLAHPNIVRLIDYAQDASVHYMVHEYIDGGDFRTLIKRFGQLPVNVSVSIVYETAQALRFMHEHGLVHRDVKPANILITQKGTAKLADLGLSVRYRSDQTLPRTGLWVTVREELGKTEQELIADLSLQGENNTQKDVRKVAGTPDYIAPDQLNPKNKPDPLWDIYSLGCTLYQALTGAVPYPISDIKLKLSAHQCNPTPNPQELNPDVPTELALVVMQMMDKNPNERVPSMEKAAELLSPWKKNTADFYLLEQPFKKEKKIFLPTSEQVFSANKFELNPIFDLDSEFESIVALETKSADKSKNKTELELKSNEESNQASDKTDIFRRLSDKKQTEKGKSSVLSPEFLTENASISAEPPVFPIEKAIFQKGEENAKRQDLTANFSTNLPEISSINNSNNFNDLNSLSNPSSLDNLNCLNNLDNLRNLDNTNSNSADSISSLSGGWNQKQNSLQEWQIKDQIQRFEQSAQKMEIWRRRLVIAGILPLLILDFFVFLISLF